MTDRAAAFLELHQPGAGFVLPNAWDAGSARMLEQVGFPAIATTSAGVPDAGVDGSDMLDCIAQIVEAVNCPVTADLESGYGATADQVADTITAAGGIGVVGANLEDAIEPGVLIPVGEARERLEAARSSAPVGSFVLNARTDVFLRAGDKDPDAVLADEFIKVGQGTPEGSSDPMSMPTRSAV